MRFCRLVEKEGICYGLVETVDGRDAVTARLDGPHLQVNGAGSPGAVVLPDLSKAKRLGSPVPLDSAKLLIPFPLVSKIVCIGRNYAEHAKEQNSPVPAEPLIFLKPPSSLLAPGGTIVRPNISKRVDHEGELGVVIGRTCHKLRPEEDERDYILGYTCVNDVTARDLQEKDGQWTRGKGFDTFCPVGPVIATGLDTSQLNVQTRVNGELRQAGNTRDLTHGIGVILRYISNVMTLLPGDIIATGTPSGISPMKAGDTVEVTVEGIGVLRNTVADE